MLVIASENREYDLVILKDSIAKSFRDQKLTTIDCTNDTQLAYLVNSLQTHNMFSEDSCVYIVKEFDFKSPMHIKLLPVLNHTKVILLSPVGTIPAEVAKAENITIIKSPPQSTISPRTVGGSINALFPKASRELIQGLAALTLSTDESGKEYSSPYQLEVLKKYSQLASKGQLDIHLLSRQSTLSDHWQLASYLFSPSIKDSSRFIQDLFYHRGFFETLGEIRSTLAVASVIASYPKYTPQALAKIVGKHPFFVTKLKEIVTRTRQAPHSVYIKYLKVLDIEYSVKSGQFADELLAWDLIFYDLTERNIGITNDI